IVDAGVTRARADARVAEPRADAAPRDASIAIDAVAMAVPPDAAVATTGFIVVKNDTWCEVTIDGDPRGRTGAMNASKPLRVDAGPHTVICEQPGTANKWTKQVEVGSGGSVTAAGSMLRAFAVTLGVDATIDGIPHKRGAVVTLKRGRHDFEINGVMTRFDVSAACTVQSTPEPGCY
ncbi:MAG TPA: hypothetical protein VFV99_07245, partial [Kofleriaceae bacterium]|nr:hypothetical protein [Kofleriaceae bacterium]